MKKYTNPYLYIQNELHPGLLFFSLFIILTLQACEINTSVPFNLPDYEPEIIIHAVASPQSGGRALIKYSQPVSGFPGEAPDLPDFEAWLVMDGIPEIRFHKDSIDLVQDNSYTVQTIFLSIPADSLQIFTGQEYSMEIRDLVNPKTYLSTPVTLPPQPIVYDFEIDCTGSNCRVIGNLGAVEEAVYAISVKGRVPDSVLTEDCFRKLNNNVFSNQLIYPESQIWQKQPLSADFPQLYHRHPLDSLLPPVDLRVSVAYLSFDIAQLIREIHGSHAIGEDIFQALRPFHSNFHTEEGRVFGIFGLYNEEIRILPL